MEKLTIFFKSISPKMWIIIGIILVIIIFLVIYFKNKNNQKNTIQPVLNSNLIKDTIIKTNFPLLKGSKGTEVKSLQSFLNANGSKLKVDGVWGSLTEIEVNKYFKTKIGSVSEVFYNSNIKGKY